MEMISLYDQYLNQQYCKFDKFNTQNFRCLHKILHCIASEEMRSIKMSFHHLTALEGMHLVYFCKGNSQSILAFTFKPLELEGSWEQKGDSVSHSTAESGRKWDKQCKSGRKRSKSVPTAENRTLCMQVL